MIFKVFLWGGQITKLGAAAPDHPWRCLERAARLSNTFKSALIVLMHRKQRRRTWLDDVTRRRRDRQSPTGRRSAGTQPLHWRHATHRSALPLWQTAPSAGVAAVCQCRNHRGHVLPLNARPCCRVAHRRRYVRFRRRLTDVIGKYVAWSRDRLLSFFSCVATAVNITKLPNFCHHFYRAMHFSAKRGIAIACRPSVCLSVCNVGGSGPHGLEILETKCTNN